MGCKVASQQRKREKFTMLYSSMSVPRSRDRTHTYCIKTKRKQVCYHDVRTHLSNNCSNRPCTALRARRLGGLGWRADVERFEDGGHSKAYLDPWILNNQLVQLKGCYGKLRGTYRQKWCNGGFKRTNVLCRCPKLQKRFFFLPHLLLLSWRNFYKGVSLSVLISFHSRRQWNILV